MKVKYFFFMFNINFLVILTARIRRMGECHIFTLCVSPNPPFRDSSASTCYAASSMPLAFTQEDFLNFGNAICLVLNLESNESQNNVRFSSITEKFTAHN